MKTPSSREAQMEQTRLKLIATARKLFGTIGFSATVMDDLTAQIGLTRGALHHQFGNKKGLFQAVLEQIDQELGHELSEISRTNKDSWDKLIERCYLYLDRVTEPDVQRIMLRDAPSVLDPDLLHNMRKACVVNLADQLEILVASGKVKPINPTLQAQFINGGLMELAVLIATSPDRESRLVEAKKEVQVLLSGLLQQ